MILHTKQDVSLSLGTALLLVFAMSLTIAQAEAVSMGKVTVSGPRVEANKGYALGIILSDTCIASVKSGGKACPSYQDLVTLDSSVPSYSGSFKVIDGFYQRVPSKYPNSMGFYQYDPTFRIFVDPPKTAKMPLITIEAQLPEYHMSDQFKVNEIKDGKLIDSKATKSIRTYSTKRFVDSTCSFATITAANWKELLPDTINFMRNNCDPNQTLIQTIQNDIKILKVHDVSTSAKWKLDRFYADTIKNCTKTYGACKTVDNRAVTTQSDKR